MLKTKNVFLFIPNIIGYFRYLFIIAAIFTYRDHPLLTILFAGLSSVLDAFDGMAARKFGQSTNFGAVLDMVCDRAADAVILSFLGALYPQYAIIFYGDILLDLTSHWYQMYAALSTGEHHKKSPSRFKLLNIYYSNKPVLFTLCAGNGLFMLVCYVTYF
jgi:CDP-diacylglycerol--inositol 3-phosphatidyltransferase